MATVLAFASPALAEEGVFTGALGGGAAVTLDGSPAVQGLVSLSGRYGISDRLNLEVPLDLALGAGPPEVLLGVGFGDVAWQTNHWRLSTGGGLAGDYSVAHHGPWSWGPYAQASLRWLAFWGVGFSLDLRAFVPVVQGELSPVQAGATALWRAVLLPTLSVYEEL